MSETNELYTSVNYIKNKVDTLEKIELLRMRSDVEMRKSYAAILKSDEKLASIYKAIDGEKGQKEIAQQLGCNEMRVSRAIKKLEEFGLIEFCQMKGNSRIYIHTVVEKAYHFCKSL